MQDALLFIIGAAADPAKNDADLLEASMAGLGTKDQALVRRVVMIHWDKQRLHQCKAAYKHFYKKDLAARIASETSGEFFLFFSFHLPTCKRIEESGIWNLFANYFDIIGDYKKLMVACVA